MLLLSESRKIYKSVCKVEKLSELSSEDSWLHDKLSLESQATAGKRDKAHATGKRVSPTSVADVADIHRAGSSEEEVEEEPVTKKTKMSQT